MSYRKHIRRRLVLSQRQRPQQPTHYALPYSERELASIWTLLTKHGNNCLMLAQALADDTGLRASEICELRLRDIDVTKRTITIPVSKATNPRIVHYGERTSRYLSLWLKQRCKRQCHQYLVKGIEHTGCSASLIWYAQRNTCRSCGHDYLLYDALRRPYSRATLSNAFARILCKKVRGILVNSEGIDHFSFHRSRMSMVTRMAATGATADEIKRQTGWHRSPPGFREVIIGDCAEPARGDVPTPRIDCLSTRANCNVTPATKSSCHPTADMPTR